MVPKEMIIPPIEMKNSGRRPIRSDKKDAIKDPIKQPIPKKQFFELIYLV